MRNKLKNINEQLSKFGHVIKTARCEKGISQEKLAEIANVHRTYIGMIERGEKNITLTTLLRISKALGVAPSKLLEDF